jgi:hypothetical protein
MREGIEGLGGYRYCASGKSVYNHYMNFALAILTYLIMAAVLGAGILLLVIGKPLLFIVSVIVFVLAFAKLGCLTQH